MYWFLRLLNSRLIHYLDPLYLLAIAVRRRRVARFLLLLISLSVGRETLQLRAIGNRRQALRVARRAAREVPAYSSQVGASVTALKWESCPVLDKDSYIRAYPISQLLASNYRDTVSIFRSSGTSGRATYWPQLKQSERLNSRALQVYLEACFQTHRRKTLIIVGLSLGSWIGGEYLSAVLKQCALQVPYPLTIFAPGNRYDEILEVLHQAQEFVDQVVLVVCPSTIGHLRLTSEAQGVSLPLDRMRYLVLGEAFPESFRRELQRESGLSEGEVAMFSIYGSADTGMLGVESRPSVALRQLLHHHPELSRHIGLSGEPPHFFHCSAPDAYLETMEGELCVTRWQGVPIVRYNLHDEAVLFSWREIRRLVLEHCPEITDCSGLIRTLENSSPHLSPVVAIYGRSDRCLILCGTNITESMLDAAVRSPSLSPLLTGMYQARVELDSGRQYLFLDLELRQGVVPDAGRDREIYDHLVAGLGQSQPEFQEDWRQVYSRWDDDPNRRVLRLRYFTWPQLSEDVARGTKHVGIRT